MRTAYFFIFIVLLNFSFFCKKEEKLQISLNEEKIDTSSGKDAKFALKTYFELKNLGHFIDTFLLSDINDSNFILKSVLKDKTLLIYFSTNCPHCSQALHDIDSIFSNYYYSKGLKILGIASSISSKEILKSKIINKELKFPFLIDKTGNFASAFNIKATPQIWILDNNQNIVFKTDTYSLTTLHIIEIFLKTILNEEPLTVFKPGHYYNPLVCKECHIKQYQSWGLSAHSFSWDALKKEGKTMEPNCFYCHSTDYGSKNGFVSYIRSRGLESVTCESCHGPGGEHFQTSNKRVPANICLNCHKPEYSLWFDKDLALKYLQHSNFYNLDWKTYVSKRKQFMAENFPDLPFLKPQDTVYQKSESCKSCHSDIYNSWVKSKHSNAWKILVAKRENNNKDCIACHNLVRDNKIIESGVSCERCHGSGINHSIDPEKFKMVSLKGKSDICIKKPFCVTCHNQRNDPKFDFENDYKYVIMEHGF